MIEHWIEVDSAPRYLVSSLGQVYDRLNDRFVEQVIDRNGYYRIHLWLFLNGKHIRKTVSVSRLVAETFYDIEMIEYKYEVNHIDGDKSNNSVVNLEFTDRSGNMLHAFRTGLAIPTYQPVRVRIIETGEEFESTGQVDRHLGVSSGSVSKTLRGIQSTCKGYTFESIA